MTHTELAELLEQVAKDIEHSELLPAIPSERARQAFVHELAGAAVRDMASQVRRSGALLTGRPVALRATPPTRAGWS